MVDLKAIREEFPIGCHIEDCYGQRGLSVLHGSFEAYITRYKSAVVYGGAFIVDNLTGRRAKVIEW